MNNKLGKVITRLLPAHLAAVWHWARMEGSDDRTAEFSTASAKPALMGNKGGPHMLMEYDVPTRIVHVYCDTCDKDVRVGVLMSEGTPYDVAHCSAFNGGPVTCDKHCLAWPSVRAA